MCYADTNNFLNRINPLFWKDRVQREFNVINYYSWWEKNLRIHYRNKRDLSLSCSFWRNLYSRFFIIFLLPWSPCVLFLHPARSWSRKASLNVSSFIHLSFNWRSSCWDYRVIAETLTCEYFNCEFTSRKCQFERGIVFTDCNYYELLVFFNNGITAA